MKRKNIKLETKLIREGLNRSNFSETSEPIFMTSSYVYDSPEQAEARFKDLKSGLRNIWKQDTNTCRRFMANGMDQGEKYFIALCRLKN